MQTFVDYAIVVICGIAILLYLGRIIRLFFEPAFLQHKVFEFPSDKLRRMLLLLCGIAVLALVVLLRLKVI